MATGTGNPPESAVLSPVKAAVAVAETSTVFIPKIRAKKVATGRFAEPSLRTLTLTASGWLKVCLKARDWLAHSTVRFRHQTH